MRRKDNFEEAFFDYQLPIPFTSVYSKQFAKSNDLRLLLEIATRSHLRMFTDTKTNLLHFICKPNGQDCFDVVAHSRSQGYAFDYNCVFAKHKCNCALEGAQFKHLEIYNLMKLKKDVIQKFMVDKNLMNQSPSLILSELSKCPNEYFFEKYINRQIQLRRKLRKRFDNIINIDIKKIGCFEQKEDKHKNEKKIKKDEVGHLERSIKKGKDINQSLKEKKNVSKVGDEFFFSSQSNHQQKFLIEKKPEKDVKKNMVESNNVEIDRIEQELPVKRDTHEVRQRIINALDILDDSDFLESKQKPKSKKIEKKLKKKKPSVNKQNKSFYNNHCYQAQNIRDSIFLLPQDNSFQGEQIFFKEKVPQSLEQLYLLNQPAQFAWSSSQSIEEQEPLQTIGINQDDYFRSLRNSTLKRSLQKESLTIIMFPYDIPNENY